MPRYKYCTEYSSAPGVHSVAVDVGNPTAHTVSGLSPATYYVAVTAYDVWGNETEFSGEVVLTVQ